MDGWVPPEVQKTEAAGSSQAAIPASGDTWMPPEVLRAPAAAKTASGIDVPLPPPGGYGPMSEAEKTDASLSRLGRDVGGMLEASPMVGNIPGLGRVPQLARQMMTVLKQGFRPADDKSIAAVRQYMQGGTEAAGPNAAETWGAAPTRPQAPTAQVEAPATNIAAATESAAPASPEAPAAPTNGGRLMLEGGKYASSETAPANSQPPRASMRRPGGEEIAKPAAQVRAQASKAERDVFDAFVTNKLFRAIYQQESGSGTANTSAPNAAGARGPMQITEDTFNRFARPGEKWGNVEDNLRVGRRIIEYYVKKFDAHPGRVAAAYYSGEGNVAAEGATPWLKDVGPKAGIAGPKVSEYVAQVMSRF